MVLHVEAPKNSRLLNMLRLERIKELEVKAKEYNYILTFDENGGTDAIFKEYTTPNNMPFAALDDNKFHFLRECYDEVKTLKEIIETTYYKFDGEDRIINELCQSLQNCTNYHWRTWPENDYCWTIFTSFNESTHDIGIEGVFAVNQDRKIEFRNHITVWEARNWDIYKNELIKHYPNYPNQLDKQDASNRVYLHLPTIIIGNDLNSWDKEKCSVIINQLKETFDYMKELTSKY